jgi:hypothetical protein
MEVLASKKGLVFEDAPTVLETRACIVRTFAIIKITKAFFNKQKFRVVAPLKFSVFFHQTLCSCGAVSL